MEDSIQLQTAMWAEEFNERSNFAFDDSPNDSKSKHSNGEERKQF